MSKSVTKARIALIQPMRNRMIPRFSSLRSKRWRSFVSDMDTNRLIPVVGPRCYRIVWVFSQRRKPKAAPMSWSKARSGRTRRAAMSGLAMKPTA